MYNTRSKTKIICRRCAGDGIISVATTGEYKCREETCPFCLGLGMMYETVTVKYEVIKK